MPSKSTEPKRFQCCHILTDGHRCGSPALKQELFCYYHHTTRKPIPPAEVQARKGRRAEFTLPRPEDRSAIQHSIGEILLRIATHGIDSRRAGLLLYGLQIASLNLPKPNPKAREEETIDEVVTHPTHGEIAPVAELYEDNRPKSFVHRLLDEIEEQEERKIEEQERRAAAAILPTLQAASPTEDMTPTAAGPTGDTTTLMRGIPSESVA